jgi:hypothetical protein
VCSPETFDFIYPCGRDGKRNKVVKLTALTRKLTITSMLLICPAVHAITPALAGVHCVALPSNDYKILSDNVISIRLPLTRLRKNI